MPTDSKVKAGVIEGFFGKPWDWSARLSTIDFLRDCEYQFYIYAPKADPFLRRQWREPMPVEILEKLSALSSRCRDRGICLGIGLTPYEIYLNYDAQAQASLRSKVLQINEIRSDMLCILFDDMRGDINELPDLQARVISDICTWSSAQRFIVCPTYYSYDSRLVREFGPAPRSYLRDLGRIIDPEVDIFWTGEKVISNGYSARHLADVAYELRRKPFIWDNHISNDSKVRTNYLFLDPSDSEWELPADLVAGLAINPMNQPHLSRIALCAYQHLLNAQPGRGREHIMPTTCRSLLEPSFAARLIADGALLKQAGLSQIGDDTRRSLLAFYDGESSNPYARDVAAWLRGDYEFDPQCLTT